MARTTIKGESTTGSEHGLEVEVDDNTVKLCITGNNGKRHATVKLSPARAEKLLDFLSTHLETA